MKRFIGLVMVLVIALGICAISANAGGLAAIEAAKLNDMKTEVSTDELVDVYVNDLYLVADVAAFIHNDRTMVPLRAICEALECEVEWIEDTETIIISNEVVVLKLQVGSYNIERSFIEEGFEAETVAMDVTPLIVNDRTFVPARAVAESLHALVEWEEAEYRVDITMEYDYIWAFKEGLARVVKDDKFGFINEKREVIVPLDYEWVGEFLNGYAFVQTGSYAEDDYAYGFVDTSGKVVVPCIYHDADFMKDGRAKVYRDGKYGYVNSEGVEFVPCKYANIDEFRNGFALTYNDGKYGYVSEDGTVIAECIYEDAYAFVNGIGVVKKDGKWGCIDETGKVIVDFIYDSEYDAKAKGEEA